MLGKITIFLILTVAVVSVFIFAGRASYEIAPLSFFAVDREILPEAFSTDTWGIFDPQTGNILLSSNTNEQKSIASISKLFTAYAALESEMLDEVVVISWNDLAAEGRAGKLSYGDQLTIRELLFPLLIESSNDAGEAIRRTLGSDFDLSLELLKRDLGLQNTSIADGSGLSERNRSTVSDLAHFYAYLYREHPHILDITKLRVYVGKEHGWVNTNPMEKINTFRGGKNGYTHEAGRTFVGAFRIPQEGRDLGLVLLGSEDLAADILVFIEYLERLR